jgi:hypothetical protein
MTKPLPATPLKRLPVVLLLCALMPVHAEGDKPEYGIKERAPTTGSLIRKFEVLPGDIPLNLSWEQLSPQDRARFQGNYERMAPGDEPPFPIGGLRTLYGPLAKANRKLQVTGDLFVVATVDATGETTEVRIINQPGSEMGTFAGQLLLLAKFKPAVCQGKPCQMDFPLRFTFLLD